MSLWAVTLLLISIFLVFPPPSDISKDHSLRIKNPNEALSFLHQSMLRLVLMINPYAKLLYYVAVTDV